VRLPDPRRGRALWVTILRSSVVYSRLTQSRSSQAPEDDGRAAGETGAPPAPDQAPAGAGLGGVVANVGERVQEILDLAERVAGDIRTEAETASERQIADSRREADRVVDERLGELASLTRSLTGQVEAVAREARALIAQLDGARERLADIGAQPDRTDPRPDRTDTHPVSAMPTEDAPAAPVDAPAAPVDTPAAPVDAAAEASPDSDGNQIPEQAVLRATQMAVAGVERTQIEHMLRSEFGVDDATTVVDKMLLSERA
jgi:hypothetical protein